MVVVDVDVDVVEVTVVEPVASRTELLTTEAFAMLGRTVKPSTSPTARLTTAPLTTDRRGR